MVAMPIEQVPVVNELTDSTDLLDHPQELRERAQADGYLFLPGLLPRDLVMQLRSQFVAIMQQQGWLRAGTDPMDAVADLDALAKEDPAVFTYCGVGVSIEAYRQVQKLELFHELAHHPNLIAMYEALFGEAVLPHPRNIARLMVPASNFSPTPPHQDYTHVQGTSSAWTCWIPVGDVPLELGGLSILAGSHHDGVYRCATASGAGNIESIICQTDHVWRRAPMLAGDVLTFHSQTVHKGNPNHFPDRIRFSCDYRYQGWSQDIEPASLNTHCNILEWEQVYQGWKNKDIQYFWKQHEVKLSPWDASLVQTHRKIC